MFLHVSNLNDFWPRHCHCGALISNPRPEDGGRAIIDDSPGHYIFNLFQMDPIICFSCFQIHTRWRPGSGVEEGGGLHGGNKEKRGDPFGNFWSVCRGGSGCGGPPTRGWGSTTAAVRGLHGAEERNCLFLHFIFALFSTLWPDKRKVRQ